MTDGDLLAEAVAELYSSDPDEFVERRGALVARAREAKQAPAAKQIAALRKPTRSAWVVNKLVRADPGVAAELAGLGEELRAAQGSLDGEAIRELSQRRRQLIESLARRAFTVVGQKAPAAGVRDEVTATLGAALADPEFAGTLAEGALVRAVQAEGFGPVGRPALTLVKGGGTARAPRAKSGAPAPRAKSGAPARAAPPSAQEVRKERERRRREAVFEAEQAAAEASSAADAATAAEYELEATVQRLEEELADARQGLADARAQARRARSRQRSAQQALDRMRD